MDERTPSDQVDVPLSAWLLAWSFVLSQVLELIRRGTQGEDSWLGSILLGVVVVTVVSHGVMRVRWVRFWLVVVLLALAVVLLLVGVVAEPTAWGVVSLAIAATQAGLLRAYTRTDWFAMQRRRVKGGPSLAPILAVAALVGVLGGLLGASVPDAGATIQL